MPLPLRTTVRRVLTGLVVAAALAGGLWWNATRLNETERKLVGVWEGGDDSGNRFMICLRADRSEIVLLKDQEDWVPIPRRRRWSATPIRFSTRSSVPWPGMSWIGWKTFVEVYWSGLNRTETSLVQLSDGGIALDPVPGLAGTVASPAGVWSFHPVTDPELLRLFDPHNSPW